MWPQDHSHTGFAVTGQVDLEQQGVVFPNLFRRLSEFLAQQQPGGLAGFLPWLAASEEQVLDLTERNFTHFDNVVAVQGDQVQLLRRPEELVFVSQDRQPHRRPMAAPVTRPRSPGRPRHGPTRPPRPLAVARHASLPREPPMGVVHRSPGWPWRRHARSASWGGQRPVRWSGPRVPAPWRAAGACRGPLTLRQAAGGQTDREPWLPPPSLPHGGSSQATLRFGTQPTAQGAPSPGLRRVSVVRTGAGTEAMAASESFEEFYAATVGRLLGQVFLVSGDLHAAEEIVQESFTRASMRWARLRDYDRPEAWVRRVAMNLAADRARSLRRQARAMLRLGPPATVPAASVGTLALVEALRTLPIRQRQAIVLHYLVDLPIQEVAQVLAVRGGTVKSLLARGRRSLATRLGEPEEVFDRA